MKRKERPTKNWNELLRTVLLRNTNGSTSSIVRKNFSKETREMCETHISSSRFDVTASTLITHAHKFGCGAKMAAFESNFTNFDRVYKIEDLTKSKTFCAKILQKKYVNLFQCKKMLSLGAL